MAIDQLCRPRQYTPETATQKDAISTEVTCLSLDDCVEEMLVSMVTYKLNVSQVFDLLWTQHGNTVLHTKQQDTKSEELTLVEVATQVWLPAKQHYDDLCKSIEDGSISLNAVDNFLHVYVGRYHELQEEFQLMCSASHDKTWIKGRVRQVMQYHQLGQGCECATLLMAAKKAFDLTDDFPAIEAIINAVRNVIIVKHST